MARLVPLLISVLLACRPALNPPELFLDRAQVSVKTAQGVCYVNGEPFSGVLIETSATGDTLSMETYRMGREQGDWKQFYPNGVRRSVRHFSNGKKQGDYQGWWPDGSLKFSYHFKDDEYVGVLKEWDVDGQLLRASTYVQGHEEGSQKAWYPNGKIRSNYVVLDGRRFGLLGTKNCVNVADSVFTEL